MPDLATFQEVFAEALFAELPVGAIARKPGFAVYRNTCARSTVEALRAAFSTVDALIGEDAFTGAALDYRCSQPPCSPVLSDYGHDFADFLARQPWTAELPYLADVAKLDRLWLECFLAPDTPSRFRAVGNMPRLALNPAARFAWLATPAMTIWQAHRQPEGFDQLEPEWRAEGALFTRRDLSIHAEQIDRAGHLLLVLASAGATLADGLAAVETAHPAADASALFARLLAAGVLTIL